MLFHDQIVFCWMDLLVVHATQGIHFGTVPQIFKGILHHLKNIVHFGESKNKYIYNQEP